MKKLERNELIKQIYEKGLLKELYDEVIASENNRRIEVGSIKPGQQIIIENEKSSETYTAIQCDKEGNVTFLLDPEFEIKNVSFGDSNNYSESRVRDISINCDPVKRAQEIYGSDAFIPVDIDLFSHDGLKDYGICNGDLAGTLTYDMYRNNRQHIKPSCMWLSTPNSTPSGNGASYVQCVYSNGCVSYRGCDWCGFGVRPFFVLKSSIFVSLVEPNV